MTTFQIEPFKITEEFKNCWFAAMQHLNLRVKDTGASWLRASLPCFREHLSFALGNQLFFIQFYDVNQPENGWLHPSRLGAAVNDANGVACLMPMKNKSGEWHPVFDGWGLSDLTGETALNPVDLITDEPIEMTDWEIHDAGIQVVRDHLKQNGWEINSWQSDLEVDPSIAAMKDGQLYAFVVRNSNKGNEIGQRPSDYKEIDERMKQRGVVTKFVGLKIADENDLFDPRLSHLKRRIYRRSGLMFSKINIEELDP